MGGAWWRPHPCRCLVSFSSFVHFWSLLSPLSQLCSAAIHVVQLLISPSRGRLRPHLVCWPGFREVLKACSALPDGGACFWRRRRFASHSNSVALSPPLAASLISFGQSRWSCPLVQRWQASLFNVGSRLFGAATFAFSGTLTSCLSFSYNDAFSDLLVLRAVWSACCVDSFSQRLRVTAISAIPSLCRLGGASPSLLPPSQTNRETISETRRI
jgi:hypothetical protein